MVEYADRPALSPAPMRRISWGAIIAGTILTLVFQILLGLLGLGIGLATIDPATSDTPSLSSFTSAGGIWTIVSVLIATFLGAYAAGRLAGSPSRRDGALHGITVWATSTLLVVYLLTSGVSAVVTNAFGALGSTVQTLGQVTGAAIPDSIDALPAGLRDDARALLQRAGNQADQAADNVADAANQAAQNARNAAGTSDLGSALSEIFQGLGRDATPEQRQAAVQAIASQANISQGEAEQRLNQFQGRYDQVMETARQTAQRAAKTASTTAFVAFVGLVLGLVAGAVGGIVGKPRRTVGYYRD